MITPVAPPNEILRIKELYKTELLDTLYEKDFDNIVNLAAQICNVPIALVTLIDVNRQWLKAKYGVDVSETERNISFCGHAINKNEMFVVDDASKDERFFDNPLVTGEPKIRFYAGKPLTTKNGYSLGTLCVIDRVPRNLSPDQLNALSVLGNNVINLIELRLNNKILQSVLGVQQKVMSVMAHDIRGPIQSLNLAFDLKNSGTLTNEEITKFDDIVQLQLRNTISLLNNIVDWGKLQLSNSKENIITFNLHKLCDDCFGYLMLSAELKHNKLINNIEPDLEVESSKQGLEFILRNLLSNSNKFTSGGEIYVSAIIENNSIKLTVKDTGIGMNMEIQKSIMSRQLKSYRLGTDNEQGSGTGLKLIFEYLQIVKGTLNIASNIGEGTLVEISYPL